MSYKNRIESIVKELNQGVYEKDQAIKLVLLSFLSGKSAFLYGPPGTAKSLIARRVALAFDMGEKADSKKDSALGSHSADLAHFEATADSKSSSAPKCAKNYESTTTLVRSTSPYLQNPRIRDEEKQTQKADSNTFLNTLLTIINEKIYRDGNTDIKVPLKGLVCASNEFPMQNQGLEALYDRLVIRLIEQKSSFEALLDEDIVEIEVTNPITTQELQDITQKAKKDKILTRSKRNHALP